MTYSTKIMGYNPIAYWQLNDKSGDVAVDVSGNGFHGTYNNVTLGQPGIGDGTTSPLFNGTNGYVDVYSTGFADAINVSEGTLIGWMKVFNASVWIDGEWRYAVNLANGSYNRINIKRHNTDNIIVTEYKAGNTTESELTGGLSTTGWMHLAVTWSVTADEVKHYYNGAKVGLTDTALGVWAGAINEAYTNIGTSIEVGGTYWHGYIAHIAVFDYALDNDEAFDLSKIPTDTYQDKVLYTNPIGYWKLDELSGDTAEDSTVHGSEGIYKDIGLYGEEGIGDGNTSIWMDGTSGNINIPYGTYALANTNVNEGSVMIWMKVNDASVWTDGNDRYPFHIVEFMTYYDIYVRKTSNPNEIQYRRWEASQSVSGFDQTDWLCVILTWDVTVNELKLFINNVQIGATQYISWSYTDPPTNMRWGAQYESFKVWHGWIAHATIWDRPLSLNDISYLNDVPPLYEEPIEKIEEVSTINREILEESTFNTELDLESTFDTEADIYGIINTELSLNSKINLEDI